KDKYEQHHGVRITDAAIVAAATPPPPNLTSFALLVAGLVILPIVAIGVIVFVLYRRRLKKLRPPEIPPPFSFQPPSHGKP
ncbi:MAG TPA: hypothetical protein VJS68_00190, partial [Thermoplasmata archaeon]|nr:hypothetical protein [Thermoplasmata archaeon]